MTTAGTDPAGIASASSSGVPRPPAGVTPAEISSATSGTVPASWTSSRWPKRTASSSAASSASTQRPARDGLRPIGPAVPIYPPRPGPRSGTRAVSGSGPEAPECGAINRIGGRRHCWSHCTNPSSEGPSPGLAGPSSVWHPTPRLASGKPGLRQDDGPRPIGISSSGDDDPVPGPADNGWWSECHQDERDDSRDGHVGKVSGLVPEPHQTMTPTGRHRSDGREDQVRGTSELPGNRNESP